MTVKLLTKHNLEFLSVTGGCTGKSESTLFKMPHCWKSHAAAQILVIRAGIHKMLAGPLVEPLKPLKTFNLVAIL